MAADKQQAAVRFQSLRERFRRGSLPLFFLFVFGGDGFEVLGFEDLPAIDALDIVDAVAAGQYDGVFMLAGGLHNQRLGYELL